MRVGERALVSGSLDARGCSGGSYNSRGLANQRLATHERPPYRRYNTTDNKARYVEWEGTCQKGRCYVCSTAPIPTAPVSYCSDGRVCVGNEFNYAVVGIFSWSFFFVNPLVMSFYIAIACLVVAIFIVLYGVSAYTYYQRKYFRHLNGESDEPDNANDDTDINSGSGSYFINPSSASSRRNGNVY